MKGRWTICQGRGDLVIVHGYDGPDGVPVVPCDDAAVERAAKAARDAYHEAVDKHLLKELWPRVAEAVLRAAGETP